MKPFKQIPVFNKDTLEISMEDFVEIQNLVASFAIPFQIIQNLYYKAINDGSITFRYEEEDGTEISEDEARERIKQAK